jgi:lipopolysaccharide export system protein LptA
MANKTAVILIITFMLSACAPLETAKFEKAYFESAAQKVAKAEGADNAPAPLVPGKPPAEASAVPAQAKTAAVTPEITAGIKNRSLSSFEITPVITPSATPTPAAKPKKKRFKIKELDISSDSLTFNKDTSITVFIGNVVLLAEGMKLNCNKLTSKNYKDNAEATGNVRAYYKAQKTSIKCGRMKYGKEMSTVEAFDGVVAEKYMDSGNTITMYADEADFETEYGGIEAKKIKKRVKVIYKDMVAFSEKVVYNDETGILEMSGKPVVKKTGSSFTASRIKVDTNKKTMKLENDIWSRIFYGDLKKAEAEAKVETNKNPAPR